MQDGLGRKAGDLIQYLVQILGSFVVGFYLSWQLTVVLMASMPLIGASGDRTHPHTYTRREIVIVPYLIITDKVRL